MRASGWPVSVGGSLRTSASSAAYSSTKITDGASAREVRLVLRKLGEHGLQRSVRRYPGEVVGGLLAQGRTRSDDGAGSGVGRGERLQPITQLPIHALEPTNDGSRVPVSQAVVARREQPLRSRFQPRFRSAVEMVVDGVGDVAVGGGKSKGVLPQGRRCVAMPEARLGLEDLAPAHEEGGKAVAQPV